jgi:sugar lactone lactonase YvrE
MRRPCGLAGRAAMLGTLALMLLAALLVPFILGRAQPQVTGFLFVSSTGQGTITRFDLPVGPLPPLAALANPTVIARDLGSPEGLALGPDGRLYVAQTGLGGGPRAITSMDLDGGDRQVVLDMSATPALRESGGPEGPRFSPDDELFFNTRAAQGFPHTGVWKLAGGTPTQIIEPFAGPRGNGEALALQCRQGVVENLLAVDFPNGRVVRRSPPFDSAKPGIDFITGLRSPNGMAADPARNLFIGEAGGAIKKFSRDGASQGILTQTGQHVRKVDLDPDGNLYAATAGGPVLRIMPDGSRQTVGNVPEGNGVIVVPENAITRAPSSSCPQAPPVPIPTPSPTPTSGPSPTPSPSPVVTPTASPTPTPTPIPVTGDDTARRAWIVSVLLACGALMGVAALKLSTRR